ncbi:MAG: M64 family metallopeptidase [Roseburia sp.]
MTAGKRILAGFAACLCAVGMFPRMAVAANTIGANANAASLVNISVGKVGNMEELCSGAYLKAYQVPVIAHECEGGEDAAFPLKNAFDNNWLTLWQAIDKTKTGSITVTFETVSPVSRIIYGLKERGNYGDGYPTKLKIAVSQSDQGDDFVEVAAGSSAMSHDKVLFILEQPVQAKRIRFIFEQTYNGYGALNSGYGGFATAAELMFLKPDPLFDVVSDLFEDGAIRQLKAKYRNDAFLDELESRAAGHPVRDYLVTQIRLAKQLVTKEITSQEPVDFPVEVIRKVGPDSENYVILFVAERYTIDEQDDFLRHTKKLINDMIEEWDIYKRYSDRINIYALRVPSNEAVSQEERSFFADSYFKTYLDNAGLDIGADLYPVGKERLYKLIEQLEKNYLDEGGTVSVAHMVMNSDLYAGRATYMSDKVPVSLSTAHLLNVMVHEFSHATGILGDEYVSSHTTASTNVTNQSDPKQAPWKEFLGFRGVTHYSIQGNLYRPSEKCMMADMNSDFCEYCKLLLSEKLNRNAKLYIAKPIAMIQYGPTYADVSEITPNNIASIKNKMPIDYRTVVKNHADTERRLKLTMRIIGKEGNQKYEKSQEFTVAPSEVKSLVVTSEILSDLRTGDRVMGQLQDAVTNEVLMNGDTYLEKYGTVTIRYRLGDTNQQTETALPNVSDCKVYLEAGSTYELKPPVIRGYQSTGKNTTDTSVEIKENQNIEVTYYYTKEKGKVTLSLEDESGVVVKQIERYVDKGKTFTPSQSDFPTKAGYSLVLPAPKVFNGVEDITLTYSYVESGADSAGS